MSALLQLLSTTLSFLLNPERFRIVDSSTGTSFGNASITLVSTGLRIQLTRDRSQISLRLQPLVDDEPDDSGGGVDLDSTGGAAVSGGHDDWYWIGVVRRLLDGDVQSGDDLDSNAIAFLERRLDDLEQLCATADSRAAFREDLRREREDRALELFG